MNCGYKDENGDICVQGVCLACRLESRVKDLEDTVALLLHHCRRTLTDDDAIMELEDMTRGTASYMKSSLGTNAG